MDSKRNQAGYRSTQNSVAAQRHNRNKSLIFGSEGAQANSDHLIGALVVTVSVSAMAETVRPARFLNLVLAIALMFAPWMFDGGSLAADLAGVAAGILLILLSLPRGRIVGHYGGWNRYLV